MKIRIRNPYKDSIYFGAFDDEHDFISAGREIKRYIENPETKYLRANQKQGANPIVEFIES